LACPAARAMPIVKIVKVKVRIGTSSRVGTTTVHLDSGQY
jgi:hypothetical protein